MSRGHIRQHGKGWVIVFSHGTGPDGKRQRRWYSGYATEKEAEIALTDLLHKKDKGPLGAPPKGRWTLRTFLEKWLTDYAATQVRERTYEGYEHIIRRHLIPALGHVQISKLTAERIQAYYKDKLVSPRLGGDRPLSARTVHHHHVTLHTALQAAVEWNIITYNPADAAKPPKFRRPEMRTLDQAGLWRFLDAAKQTPYFALFYLDLFTGMRRSEALGLLWKDVNLEYGVVRVTRGLHRLRDGRIIVREPKSARSRRQITLPPSASIALREHRESEEARRVLLGMPALGGEDLVFSRPDGSPLLPDTITHAWMKLAKRTGFAGVRLHDARHTHASLMLEQGVHPKVVQERLGHATIATTLDVYSHVSESIQEAAAQSFDEALRRPVPIADATRL
jgi:integrase